MKVLRPRSAGRLGEGGDLQGHAVGPAPGGAQARFGVPLQGRPSAATRPQSRLRWSRTRDHSERRTCRAVHASAAAAVHDRLRDPRFSATESDDVLQDSYLRWAEVDLATVRDTKSYLAQLVTRQALNALRAGARRREEYIGPWLPEPLLLDDRDASADVVLAESVSMAMLVLLETLRPDERAVFVLREVFGVRLRRNRRSRRQIRGQRAPGRAPCARTRAGAAQALRTRRLRDDG